MRSILDLSDLARASQSFIVSSMDHLGPSSTILLQVLIGLGRTAATLPRPACRRGQLGTPHLFHPPSSCPPTSDGFCGPCCSTLHEPARHSWSHSSTARRRMREHCPPTPSPPPPARPMLATAACRTSRCSHTSIALLALLALLAQSLLSSSARH